MTTNRISPSAPDELASRVDAAFRQAAAATAAPGVQAAVMRQGEVVWTGAHGLADVAAGTPVTDETMFCLASFGKLVIAAAALRQAERGLLDLDAPLRTYLGDEVPGSSVVTTRMLLTQTAGYPDIYTTPQVAPLLPYVAPGSTTPSRYDPDRPFTWSMLAPAYREPVEPGRHWAYSNAGYILLAQVLVAALGGEEAMQDACSAFIHTPVGIPTIPDRAFTLRRSPDAAALLARGYDPLADGSVRDAYDGHRPRGIPTDLFGLPFGDGMFAGTALGAARFLDGLFVGTAFLHPESIDEMTTPTPQSLADADLTKKAHGYGAGTMIEDVARRRWHGHPGMYGGFSSNGATDLARGVTVVVLANGTWLPDEEHPERIETASESVWRALAAACAEAGA
ncbi:serine hydrolase [Pimelobacter simplex]|uniref:Beta-lactamase n=1 Tax=Nocardioides simplex TaxID=2045 RepID=A0A0A1DMP1_NOCSI|nr:serine hydrolase domain-containing protein [Pimelobacter simplex]AIY18619.1 Beta-lactamase [Pimelobacter simplex]MCG8153191.1 serine hydrolase [Pimelobacter simplex]GEB14269.1 beta-lactamase/esterase [Pimelobacter simplex]SFM31694.1 CubicO group peptidase, beta-lactamase class C family [Pimelobacter simplex]